MGINIFHNRRICPSWRGQRLLWRHGVFTEEKYLFRPRGKGCSVVYTARNSVGISPTVSGCMVRRGGRCDRDGQKKRGLWHKTRGEAGNKNMCMYLGESNEFGLFLEKNERLLEGFQQLGGETMFCLLKW